MKFWIDLTNSPHVIFFEYLIKDLQREHEVILTCRPLSNTIELLDLFKFSYNIIGRHYGKNILKKFLGFFLRVAKLYQFLRNKEIDVAISHSSFYSPMVARLIGSHCIYLNDNEHAAGNRIAFIFANKILVPEFIDQKKIMEQWARSDKILQYPGIKEGVYLWNFDNQFPKRINMRKRHTKKTVYIRPEPFTAQYYKGKRNFMDELLLELKSYVEVVLLPRTKDQELYYQREKFQNIFIQEKSIYPSEIFHSCDLFIGAGGTMTREAAVLGIPTISVYQDKLLDVDKYLINAGCMVHQEEVSAEFVLKYLARSEKKQPNKILLQKGKIAYHLIRRLLFDHTYANSISPLNPTLDPPVN